MFSCQATNRHELGEPGIHTKLGFTELLLQQVHTNPSIKEIHPSILENKALPNIITPYWGPIKSIQDPYTKPLESPARHAPLPGCIETQLHDLLNPHSQTDPSLFFFR